MKLGLYHYAYNMKNLNSVTLQLNGELANVGLKHLKHDDLVYVSGHLGSYHKVSPSGERHIVYKV
jgi:hypothetical protein